MDIISHTCTGLAVGTVVATISDFSWKKKGAIILLGGLGGALPDLDAISLWSKFDSTIGAFLGLDHSGRTIYYGKYWYSHHAALHSILAPIVLICLVIIGKSFRNKTYSLVGVKSSILNRKYRYLAFFLGFFFHLLEDMPTPSGPWGGVNLFFPSSNYIGGYGKIWWWNNYDLVLIIFALILCNLIVNLLPKHFYQVKWRASVANLLIGVFLFVYQINNRPIDFTRSGNYQEYEAQSKQIQQDILGAELYEFMLSVDNKIPLNF
jgi:inner membrane protein